jgi:hypothetical protein
VDSILSFHTGREKLRELIRYRFVDVYTVKCNAGLARVLKLGCNGMTARSRSASPNARRRATQFKVTFFNPPDAPRIIFPTSTEPVKLTFFTFGFPKLFPYDVGIHCSHEIGDSGGIPASSKFEYSHRGKRCLLRGFTTTVQPLREGITGNDTRRRWFQV